MNRKLHVSKRYSCWKQRVGFNVLHLWWHKLWPWPVSSWKKGSICSIQPNSSTVGRSFALVWTTAPALLQFVALEGKRLLYIEVLFFIISQCKDPDFCLYTLKMEWKRQAWLRLSMVNEYLYPFGWSYGQSGRWSAEFVSRTIPAA